ncbi:hypothetical protein BDR26DRAFT_874339 [Obelidium mucronatum]|nr:hypothetical protein BDR26DRAFT_874339 [Obelidium mucronatum]
MTSAITLNESEISVSESIGLFRFNPAPLNRRQQVQLSAAMTPDVVVQDASPPAMETFSWLQRLTKSVFKHQAKIIALEQQAATDRASIAALEQQAASDRARIAALDARIAALEAERIADRLQFQGAILRLEAQMELMRNNCSCGGMSRQSVWA